MTTLKEMLDLDVREKIILYPLIFLIILFGVYPVVLLDLTQSSVQNLIVDYQSALASGGF